MAEQLASVPEESSTDFTALSPPPPWYFYRESFLSVARRIRSTLSSQSGPSGSNHFGISGGTSSSYMFNFFSSPSAGAEDFRADEFHQGRPSKQPASVPEGSSTTGSTAPCLPVNSYRESIQSVAWPKWRAISALSPQSGQSGSSYSSYSGASSSYSHSSRLGSAGATDSPASELTAIAHRMVSDGYTKHMVQAFGDGSDQLDREKKSDQEVQDRAVKNWFVELDVDWVLELDVDCIFIDWVSDIDKSYRVRPNQEHLAGGTPASIKRWIRALTIIVASIKEQLDAAVHEETSAIAEFGKASISAMLVGFVEVILYVCKAEDLQPLLHMYICVSSASYDMSTVRCLVSSEAQLIFSNIADSLATEARRLSQAISTTMKRVIVDNDDDWLAPEILRGGGEVHKNTRWAVDFIMSMREVQASTQNSTQSNNSGTLRGLIQNTVYYLNDVLWKKSEMFPDPSLRYLFLLNNSNFVERSLDVEMGAGQHLRLLIGKSAEYMESFISVSWGDLWPKTSLGFREILKPRRDTSLLAKVQSRFHKIYQAQKLWKVPNPHLRLTLRETITKRVISCYRHYLISLRDPELEKQVSSGSNSPEIWEEMLGELFEG
uniref:Uncharacterized protein n=1 Tax=Avena sativa TaxID=4498 RepID=A0ACD5Z0P3_AVESA